MDTEPINISMEKVMKVNLGMAHLKEKENTNSKIKMFTQGILYRIKDMVEEYYK